MNKVLVGRLAVILGLLVFIAVLDGFIIRLMGVGIAYLLINYGLHLLGKPSLFVLVQQSLNSMEVS